MALKQNVTHKGLLATDAYMKVTQFTGDKSKIDFQVTVFDESQTHELEMRYFSLAYDLDGDNPIKQSYEHLKTLPEFLGAIDC